MLLKHATLNLLIILCLAAGLARAEDGYRLWLRYDAVPASYASTYSESVRHIAVPGRSEILASIKNELTVACRGLLGKDIEVTSDDVVNPPSGTIVAGTPETSSLIRSLDLHKTLSTLGPEGFMIRSLQSKGNAVIVIASSGEAGVLYGAFRFLRLIQTLRPITHLDLSEKPRLAVRVLNHWDNLDGTIERGYAGKSLWDWDALPDKADERLTDYARANASIGINGSVLNNVNANSKSLSAEYLAKTAAIARVFRRYGMRVYLSARFSAPIELGGLKTADPLDPQVIEWWKKKADEIYNVIPDFGGFVVKANSEGQPGPRTYNRSHVEGANMLAGALSPHHGIVMWRAFVYDPKPGYDRAAAAYDNLQPFDGKFASNVLLQVKNGPIDFQPREPFHPLFGAMPKTQVMAELQITQEYLGFSNHLVFLAPMWREFLDSDTHAKGRGSTVSKVLDGSVFPQRLTGIAGVANTGSSRNWTGHDFAQANWYAFGRLAWNLDLKSDELAREWVRMTLTYDPAVIDTLTRIMCESHDALVDYMTPLGLHHIMWPGHHYGPAPWWDGEKRPDWNSVYYHHADATGVGFDRTEKGSNAVSQYHKPVRDVFGDVRKCPEKFLLWFHHVPWGYRLRTGQTLWDGLAFDYQRGVDWVRSTRRAWDSVAGAIDNERHAAVAAKLAIQDRDAAWWRDAVMLYFQSFSKRPLPDGVEKPQRTLDEYKAKSLDW